MPVRVVMSVIVAMIVAAVLVMPMAMFMMVAMMIVMSVLMTVMIMTMLIARGRGCGISAAFRLEWRVDHRHLGAERPKQCFGRVIAFDANAIRQQLNRDMPVAEMPGQPRQHRYIRGSRLDQRFGGGHDLHQVASVEQQ